MTETEAFEHWIDTFDGGLVVTNRLIWAAAWKAATEVEREACAKVCDRLAEMMEQGAGELQPGGRLRQAAQMMRSNKD